MLKNVLTLLVSALICFTSSTFAISREGSFYLKTIATISKASDIKTIEEELNFNLSHESGLSPAIGLGVGYHINDNYRVDLIFEHLKFNFNNQSASFESDIDDTLTAGTKAIKRTASGKSLMFNGFVDFIERDSFKFFVGAGVGAVQIKEKISHGLSGTSISSTGSYTFPLITENHISKMMTKLAYSLMVGANINVRPDLNVELMYSWKNFGKVKHNELAKSAYKGHHFSVGTRFDL
jgi:opacity protein-like surface antigen